MHVCIFVYLQELNTTRDAVLAAAPNAEIKVRWLSPMRVTVSLVDWQKTDAAVKALPVFSANCCSWGQSLCDRVCTDGERHRKRRDSNLGRKIPMILGLFHLRVDSPGKQLQGTDSLFFFKTGHTAFIYMIYIY